MLDLKEHEVEWVTRHFGHTLDVHNISYRTTSDIIERVHIAKLLLLQDHNDMAKFVNKNLRDITFEGMLQIQVDA